MIIANFNLFYTFIYNQNKRQHSRYFLYLIRNSINQFGCQIISEYGRRITLAFFRRFTHILNLHQFTIHLFVCFQRCRIASVKNHMHINIFFNLNLTFAHLVRTTYIHHTIEGMSSHKTRTILTG